MKKNKLNIDFFTIFKNIASILKIFFKRSKFQLLLLLFLYTLLGVSPTISIIITRELINCISDLSLISYKYIWFFVFLYIIVDVITVQLNNFLAYLTTKLQLKFSLFLNSEILNKAVKLSVSDFENSETYNKISRAQNNTNIFSYFLNSLELFKLLVSLISSTLILIFWKWWIVIPILTYNIINTILNLKINKEEFSILRKRATDDRKRWYYKYLLTSDISFKEIKIFDIGSFFIRKYMQKSDDFFKQDNKINNKRLKLSLFCSLMDSLILAVTFIYLIVNVLIDKIMLGDFLAYLRSITNAKNSIISFLNQFSNLYRDTLYIEQFFEFFEIPEEDQNFRQYNISTINSIELINLSYKYKDTKKYALKNINLKINKGDHTAVLGNNGSGKTTLIKLIAGFYEDYEGIIKINNIDLKQINKISYYKQIGILFQDFSKYELSIRENVGITDIENLNNDSKIQSALDFSNFNSSQFESLDSQLGFWFDGKQISGGEWLRIGISRTFFRNGSLLILDEPSAALDNTAEEDFFDKINNLPQSIMSIIITHKTNYINDRFNKIIILNDGEIVS